MSEFLTEINYDKLIEKSLKNVVVEALKIAERQGLPGEHHFYITFKTNHPQTRISDQLKSQYPEEMTIVIQHQFSNLIVETSGFGIDLSFGGIRQTLYIPFDAITYFADPYAKFGLSFNFDDEPISHNTDNDFAAEMAEEPKKPPTASQPSFPSTLSAKIKCAKIRSHRRQTPNQHFAGRRILRRTCRHSQRKRRQH